MTAAEQTLAVVPLGSTPTLEEPTRMLVRTISTAALNVGAYVYTQRVSGDCLMHEWTAKHARHERPVIITLLVVPVEDEPALHSLAIEVQGDPPSVLVAEPHHVVASGIVSVVLRGYGLQGII